MVQRISVFAAGAAIVAASACGATQPDPVYTPPASPGGVTQTSPTEVNTAQRGLIPAGQELDVRLQSTLSSETATVEQRFETVTVADVTQDGAVLIPAGSVVRGVVTAVERPGRLDRTGRLTLSFDQVVVRGQTHPIRAMATRVFESGGIREEAGTAGVGAGAGAIVGGIIGGLQGAVVGAAIGAGGAIIATEGKDVTLPAGSIVRIRFDSPVTLR